VSSGEAAGRPLGALYRSRRTEKLSEVLAREILHDIVERDLPTGAKLPSESHMLKTYEVGRASLREALRILEIQGLIQIKPGPGGGPVVAGVHSRDFGKMATMYFHASRATFGELMEARLVMEPVMARHAAQRQDPAFLPLLEQVVEQSRAVVSADDRAYQVASTGFHDLVAGMSGNRILDLMGRALKDIYLDRIEGLVYPTEDREFILKEHDKISQAILKGDATRAERLMRDHMAMYAERAKMRFPELTSDLVQWR
jgi:GntR family transcriptional regulator, transcriptional repressor for pyruvate dehydrogenase complex